MKVLEDHDCDVPSHAVVTIHINTQALGISFFISVGLLQISFHRLMKLMKFYIILYSKRA